MKSILVIFLGGGLGAVLRFLFSRGVYAWLPSDFPWGILACNVLGSLVMGVLAGIWWHDAAGGVLWRGFLMVGLLGGFTTFSSFSLDTVTLMQSGQWGLVLLNVGLSLSLCFLATGLGFLSVRSFLS